MIHSIIPWTLIIKKILSNHFSRLNVCYLSLVQIICLALSVHAVDWGYVAELFPLERHLLLRIFFMVLYVSLMFITLSCTFGQSLAHHSLLLLHRLGLLECLLHLHVVYSPTLPKVSSIQICSSHISTIYIIRVIILLSVTIGL